MMIFGQQYERDLFMEKAFFYSKRHGVSIESVALLFNHFHFVLRQNRDKGVEGFLTRMQQFYAMYYNRKHRRRGQVFEGRFNAIPIETASYRRNIYNYILNNPLRS